MGFASANLSLSSPGLDKGQRRSSKEKEKGEEE
jgi:hypothetical protein